MCRPKVLNNLINKRVHLRIKNEIQYVFPLFSVHGLVVTMPGFFLYTSVREIDLWFECRLLGEKARLEVIKDTAHAPQIDNIVYKFLNV